MITIPINTNYRFKFPVIDQDTGKFVTGLTIAYSLVKTSDGTVIGSGNCSEVGTTGVYYFEAFGAIANALAAGDITAAVVDINSNTDTDTADIAGIKARTDLIPDHPASVESTGGQIGAI